MGLWDFSYAYAVNTMDIDQSIDGIKTFLNFPILPIGFPIEDTQAANKFYVDYASQQSVTFENLLVNGDVGPSADQVAVGNHSHDNLPTDDQKDALDTSQFPSAANPFITWSVFATHANRHEVGGPDEIDLTGLSGGPVTLNGIRVKITYVTTTPYNVSETDVHLSIETNASSKIVSLPPISSVIHGQRYTVKDGSGNASINNIFITPSGTDQVDNGGAGISFDITADNEVLDVIANSITKNWEVGP
jgi:hypothetical protein